jgi:hypothetical protein
MDRINPMNGFKLPLTMSGNFSTENKAGSIKESIDDFIDLIVFSPNGSFKADYYFGFVFQNTRFENSDEDEQIDAKKIHGESFNKNNYAYDLKIAIEEYEPRIEKVRIMMNYDADNKKVSIDVNGRYEEDFTEKIYNKNITFYIW